MNTQAVVKAEPSRALSQTWTLPLTQDEEFLIDLLTHKYEGRSPEFQKEITPTSITLSIPRLHHVFSGSRT